MLEKTLPPPAAKRLYDLIGRAYDLAGAFEGRGQQFGSQQLNLGPGLRLLEIGVGTGRQHARLAAAVQPGGLAVGLDLSSVMARLTLRRTGSPVCQADGVRLPFGPQTFDRVYAAYVLDLMAPADLAPRPGRIPALPEARRAAGRRGHDRGRRPRQPCLGRVMEGGVRPQPNAVRRLPAAQAIRPGRRRRVRSGRAPRGG